MNETHRRSEGNPDTPGIIIVIPSPENLLLQCINNYHDAMNMALGDLTEEDVEDDIQFLAEHGHRQFDLSWLYALNGPDIDQIEVLMQPQTQLEAQSDVEIDMFVMMTLKSPYDNLLLEIRLPQLLAWAQKQLPTSSVVLEFDPDEGQVLSIRNSMQDFTIQLVLPPEMPQAEHVIKNVTFFSNEPSVFTQQIEYFREVSTTLLNGICKVLSRRAPTVQIVLE